MLHKYEKNGAAIYKKSFRIIREESKLDHFSVDEEPVAVGGMGGPHSMSMRWRWVSPR